MGIPLGSRTALNQVLQRDLAWNAGHSLLREIYKTALRIKHYRSTSGIALCILMNTFSADLGQYVNHTGTEIREASLQKM